MEAIDVGMTTLVVIAFAAITAVIAIRMPQQTRAWVALAFVEYLLCAVAQLVYSRVVVGGGDTMFYSDEGAVLANLLDTQWDRAAPETLSLLFQQPSALDNIVIGGGSNTGSMAAAAGWLIFLARGSTYAAAFVVTGMSFLAMLAIFNACRDALPSVPAVRLFIPTVAFPSVAFWTAAMHKEAFCVIGLGLLFAAWRAVYRGKFRALPYATLGVALILVFRAPALEPLLLGFGLYVLVERVQKLRGPDAVLLGPLYLGFVIAALVGGMFAVTRLVPTMALSQLGDTVSSTQQGWALSRGGSALGAIDDAPQSLAGQLARAPVGLVNALFRPQLFDVHNVGALISAVEMTTITLLVVRGILRHGLGQIAGRIRRSPFLMMCAATTLVGCTFVGLATLNLGSLARYRVPFLPFYGMLVSLLAVRERAEAPAKTSMPRRMVSSQALARAAIARARGAASPTRAR